MQSVGEILSWASCTGGEETVRDIKVAWAHLLDRIDDGLDSGRTEEGLSEFRIAVAGLVDEFLTPMTNW